MYINSNCCCDWVRGERSVSQRNESAILETGCPLLASAQIATSWATCRPHPSRPCPEHPINCREATLHLTWSSTSLPFAHPRGSESVHPFVCPPIPSSNHRLNAYSALSVLSGVVRLHELGAPAGGQTRMCVHTGSEGCHVWRYTPCRTNKEERDPSTRSKQVY